MGLDAGLPGFAADQAQLGLLYQGEGEGEATGTGVRVRVMWGRGGLQQRGDRPRK